MKKSISSILLLISLASGDFIRDNDKGVVLDTSTNLIWQDEPYTSEEATANSDDTEVGKALHWENAISYCENLTYGTYSNWHLPNFNELYSLADRSKYRRAISEVFQNVVSSIYWSSTTTVSNTSDAWSVFFYNGGNYNGDKTYTYYVRCVRPAD